MKRSIGKVNYEVIIPERKKPNVVFHVNMLRKWTERKQMSRKAFLQRKYQWVKILTRNYRFLIGELAIQERQLTWERN